MHDEREIEEVEEQSLPSVTTTPYDLFDREFAALQAAMSVEWSKVNNHWRGPGADDLNWQVVRRLVIEGFYAKAAMRASLGMGSDGRRRDTVRHTPDEYELRRSDWRYAALQRFVDEGADFRNYTYAKYGRVILQQPGMFAWQVFDNKIIPSLRDEYRIKRVTKVRANTLKELCQKMEGVNAQKALETIKEYNMAVRRDIPFNMAIKDGRRTEGLAINKSNWANTIEDGPFEAYQVGCGVSFSFGGVRIDPDSGQVIDSDMNPIPGLYAAGELVGGIFYFNYPGGSGLMSGAVFGRIAGTGAAAARNA